MLESSEEAFEGFDVLRSFKANSCRIFADRGRAENIYMKYNIGLLIRSFGMIKYS